MQIRVHIMFSNTSSHFTYDIRDRCIQSSCVKFGIPGKVRTMTALPRLDQGPRSTRGASSLALHQSDIRGASGSGSVMTLSNLGSHAPRKSTTLVCVLFVHLRLIAFSNIQHVKMHSFDLITTVCERDIGPAHFRTGKHPLSPHGMISK